ncbi:MAG TPA: SDR family NAD(P)-dependent oxidoreductase [Ohtaekwangia sp.]|nr:SDR family NAD(P)-dependent oxidoreductase [Ohtaekwangia sp.]
MTMQTGNRQNNDSQLNTIIKWGAGGFALALAATSIYKALTRFSVEGKVFLITGGSRGLGLELSRQLVQRGARLAICARSTEQLEKARLELESLGGDVIAVEADVTSRRDVNALVKQVVSHFGKIDVLINNAGIIQVGPQDAMKISDYKSAMDTNFWAALYTMHATLPYFLQQGSGRIINITSIGGKIAVPHLLPYSASKFALVGLSEGMHAELKKKNIHVTTVVPNLMRTGSPRNITVKGNHEAEYAWFKISGSAPLLSQSVSSAAKNIIRALEYGEVEAVLGLTTKAAVLLKGIAPGWVGTLASIANGLLPKYNDDDTGVKGKDAESRKSRGRISSRSDRAAVKNNEM